jgi:hypothetical protein
MDTAAGDYPPGDPGASGAGRDRALPGLSEAFHVGLIPAAESGQRSGQALRAAAVIPVASPFDRRVIWVGGIVFAVLMALSARYGFDRDELYFLDGARHLQASYVDQPASGPCWRGCHSSCSACRCPGCGCGPRSRRGPRWWSAG